MKASNRTAEDEYISGRESARRLGVHHNSAAKILLAGGVRRRVLPGMNAKWNASDVAALLEASIQGKAPESGRAAG